LVGSIEVVTHTLNLNLVPGTRYTISLDGAVGTSVASDTIMTLLNIASGSHTVALSGVPALCTGTVSKQAQVAANATVQVGFVVICSDGMLRGDRIVFMSSRDGDREIFLMNPDGSGLTNLTDNSRRDDGPSWSPDGNRIAFSSDRSGAREIWLMEADGTQPTKLTDSRSLALNPAWSPDGSRIAFDDNRILQGKEIWTIDVDGTNETRITNESINSCSELATWSPDGAKLLFSSDPLACSALGFDLYTIDVDGTNKTQLTSRPGPEFVGDISPDGRKIVFGSLIGGNFELPTEVFLMNADGTGVIRLTVGGGDGARWSPDGTRLVFGSERNGNPEIYVMAADGSDIRRITTNVAPDQDPRWRPR
jgi:Tol biopolymer transport system component